MSRPVHTTLLDNDGLQADVMRFLAIIAFCLIAVMALVPELPPQPASVPTPEQVPEKIAETVPVETEPQLVAVIQPEPKAAEPVLAAKPTPKISKPEPPREVNITSPEPVQPPVTPAPLSLRFQSEQDFLSLLGSGRITLYAKTANTFVQLNRDFSVSPVSLSGELFELLPSSLPTKILKVMQRQNAADLFLVALPTSTAKQIATLSQRHHNQGGSLLINHEGNVNHETSG